MPSNGTNSPRQVESSPLNPRLGHVTSNQHSPSYGSRPRQRTYSWKGESPPYEPKSAKVTFCNVNSSELLPMIGQEARCTAAWVVICAITQIMISILVKVASYAYPVFPGPVLKLAGTWDGVVVGPSVIAGCLLRLVPSQVITQEAPGFIYASAWILLAIRARMGSIPHVPSRICEAVLGRLSAMECIILVGIQFACTLSTVTVVRYCVLPRFGDSNMALSAIEYTSRAIGDGHPWIVDFFRELFVTTMFTVTLQVVPVLLQLNRGPLWLTLLFVYPWYIYGVDSVGRASTLSPSILFALGGGSSIHSDQPNVVLHCMIGRCLAQMLGGFLSGQIMLVYFPDDDMRA